MNYREDSKPKLNIFALPNQTTILFSITVGVLLGALIIGSLNRSPIPVWLLAVALVFLSFRAFINQMWSEINRHGLQPVGNCFPRLQETIDQNAKVIKLRQSPRLLIGQESKGIYTFGSFRHWYIAVGNPNAKYLESSLQDDELSPAVNAVIYHELYHFKTGDYWQLGILTQVIRQTLNLMLWACAFFTGWAVLLIFASSTFFLFNWQDLVNIDTLSEVRPIFDLITQNLPNSTELEALRQKAMGINLGRVIYFAVSATLPFIILSIFLWFIYRPKFWRMREVYADAGAVHSMGKTKPFIDRFAILGDVSEVPASCPRRSLRNLLKLRLNYWPSPEKRLAYVDVPYKIYDTWFQTAILLGSLTLLFDILLVSPLTLYSTGSYPMHFTTLVIAATTSLYLIPQIAVGKPVWKDILGIIGCITLIRLVWLLMTLSVLWAMLLISPKTLADVLSAGVGAVAHYAGVEEIAFGNLVEFVMKASVINLAQVVVIFTILLATVFSVAFIYRKTMTWYSFPKPEKRLMQIQIGTIFWSILVLSLTVLPVVTSLLLNPYQFFHIGIVLPALLGFLILATGLIWLFRSNSLYGHQCPECGQPIPGDFYLGKACPNCQVLLFPWLIANYDDSY